MKVFVNEEGKIKAIHVSDDTSLHMYELDETVKDFPFSGWSVARIMCYRINVMPIMEDVEVELTEEEMTEKQAEIDSMELSEGEEKPTVPTTKIVRQETGKHMVTMLTPYVDSRLIEKIEDIYKAIYSTKHAAETVES